MKRFTATEKWNKEWFQGLSLADKCLWQYICDNCDHAGVWDANFKLASFQVGAEYTPSSLKVFGSRIEHIGGSKYWLVDFIEFQYGELSAECRAHGPVFKSIEKHGLIDRVFKGYSKGINTLKDKDKDKDKDKEGECEGKLTAESKTPTLVEVKTFCSMSAIPENIGEIWFHDHDGRPRAPSGKFTDRDGNEVFKWQATIKGYAEKWRANNNERKMNANNNPGSKPRVDGGQGTANDGKASQYRGVGKVGGV